MTLTDDVIKVIKENPTGMTTIQVLKAIYPKLESWEVESRRCGVYAKLHNLEKHGLVEGVVLSKTVRGNPIKTWKWIE